MSAKRDEFNRLWNSSSKPKREQFRNRMKSKLVQIGVPVNEDNARGFYLGELKPEPRERYVPRELPQRRPRPRRGGRRPPPRRR